MSWTESEKSIRNYSKARLEEPSAKSSAKNRQVSGKCKVLDFIRACGPIV